MFRTLSRFFSLFVWIAVGHIVVQGQESLAIRIMTYNIHHGEGVDGKLDLNRIAQIIVRHNCDLVALQEVDRNTRRTKNVDQLEELGKLTNMQPYYGPAIEFEGGQYGNGVLSRLPVSVSKSIPLPSSQNREKRAALELLVTPSGQKPFVLVCTHLDHSRDDADRIAQMKKISELFGHGPNQVVLAGDFNATYESREFEPIRAQWIDADSKNMSPTIPVDKPSKKIDFILLGKDQPWQVESVEVLSEKLASDHLPLMAALRRR